MSCCCCQSLEWCARFCCTALNRHKKSSYAGIQFSQVPSIDLKEPFPVHNQKQPLTSGYDSSTHHGSSNLAHDRSQFTHLQMDILASERQMTEQPSGEDISKKLQHTGTESFNPYHISDLHHVEFESVTLYREKAVDPQKEAMIQFSLQYDLNQSKLNVHLQHATNLPIDGNPELSQCDPFVMLHLEPDREDIFQSKVIKSTRDPVFNQTFEFEGLLIQYMKHQMLVLRLYNQALNNKSIGKVRLQLCDVDLSGIVVQMKIILTEKMEVGILRSMSHQNLAY